MAFALIVIGGLIVASLPVSPGMSADLVLDRLAFEYRAHAGDKLPAHFPSTSPVFGGFGKIDLFSAEVKIDGVPLEASSVQLGAARSEARARFPASRVEWAGIADGSTVTLEVQRSADAADPRADPKTDLKIDVSGGLSRFTVTTSKQLELTCEHCVLIVAGQPERNLGPRTKLSIHGGLATRVDISGGDADVFTVSVPAPAPLEWKGFFARAFNFREGLPLGATSSVAGQGAVTVLDEHHAITPFQPFLFTEVDAIAVNSLAITGGHLVLALSGRVRSLKIGSTEHTYSFLKSILGSQRWSSLTLIVVAGLSVVSFLENLRIRISRTRKGAS